MAKKAPEARKSRAAAAKKSRPLARARVARQAGAAGEAAPVRPGREARSAERREVILTAALDEFAERGFGSARLDDVAKRAGIAKGTIYLYFRDKETLFQELLREMLTPSIGGLEALGQTDIPARQLAEHMRDVFVHEVFETRRKDVIRLMIAEGRRFPKIAEFYHREVLSRIFEALRVILKRAARRGEVPEALVEFPHLLAAPGLLAIVWTGLFGNVSPLDVRKMMQTHIDILFAPRSKS